MAQPIIGCREYDQRQFGISYEDYARIRLHNAPNGLKETLWLWAWREGLHRVPISWDIEVLKEAVGLAFIAPMQHVVDRLALMLNEARN